MNRNAIKIIALTLTISAISSVLPSTLSISTSEVMASSLFTGVESLYVCRGESSSSLTLYKDSEFKSSTNIKSSITKYYAQLPENTSKFNIEVEEDDGYTVEITADGKRYNSKDGIPISKGSSINAKIKVYDDEDDSLVNTITINVTRAGEGSSDSDDDDEDNYDAIYLDKLKIKSNDKDIDFDFDSHKEKFSVNVGNTVDKVTIVAEPSNDDDKVKINGIRVNEEDDDYEKDVNLGIGNNTIKITVENKDDEKRQYIINIKREGNTSISNTTSTSDKSTNNSIATIVDGKTMATGIDIADSSFYDKGTNNSSYVGYVNKTADAKNKWVKNGVNWQYFDNSGNPLRNKWFKDSDGKWYYFQTNAYMTTGWRFIDGSWYYFDKTGYMLSNKWVKDTDGKWYYFTGTGEMARNETINGYRIGSKGYWIE